MSDGHFNRAILPHKEYQSALKVGKAMERQKCEKALQQALCEYIKDDNLKSNILERYKEILH